MARKGVRQTARGSRPPENGRIPFPAASRRKQKKALGVFELLAVVLVVVVFVAARLLGFQAAPPKPHKLGPLHVSAKELAQAYGADAIAAQHVYGGRELIVSGKVAGIDRRVAGSPSITLKGTNRLLPPQADLVDADKPRVNDYKTGESIKLSCRSVSEVMNEPMLHDCAIQ